LGGLLPGEFDQLEVGGNAILAGNLFIELLPGFTPNVGDQFEILNIVGSRTGVFANAADGQRLTTVDGLGSFVVNYGDGSPFDPSQIVLSNFLAVAVPGDYSQNGVVDAADYVVWRNNLGSATSLPNDDTASVGSDDYTRWRGRFGQIASSGSALPSAGLMSAAVPEPSTFLLLMLCAGISVKRRRTLTNS
jgi:hypothetical protein